MTTELENIRKNKSSFWPYVIIGFILIGMVLFGASDFYQGGTSSNYALKVNKESVSEFSYRNSLQNEIQNQPKRKQEELENEVKQRLINQLVLLSYAKENDTLASDKAVAENIRSIDFLQREGKFDTDLYLSYLTQNGITAEQDAKRTRDSLSISLLLNTLSDVSVNTEIDKEVALKIAGIGLDVKYFTLDKSNYELKNVTEEDIKEYYDTHPELYQSEENISLDYVKLDLDTKNIKDEEINIESLYDDYVSKEKSKGISADYWLFANEKTAKESIGKIKAGNFNADELGDNFLDMGKFSANEKKGEKINKALLNISKVNDLSDTVKTEDGYFLLRLTGRGDDNIKPIDEIKDSLIGKEKERLARASFEDKSIILEEAVFKPDATIENIASSIGRDVMSIKEAILTSNEGILSEKSLKEIIASDSFEVGKLAEPIVEDDKIIVYMVKENNKPSLIPYEKAKEKAEKDLKTQSLREAIEMAAKDIKEEVKEKGLSAVAEEKGYEIQKISNLNYKVKENKLDILAKFAILKNPENIGKENVNYTKTTNGNILMFVIDDVHFNEVDENQKAFIIESIDRLEQQGTIVGFLEYLTKNAKIKDNTKGL